MKNAESNYKNIELKSLKGLFAYQETLKMLSDAGINTVGDLLTDELSVTEGDFTEMLKIMNDMRIARKFVECKYENKYDFKNIEECLTITGIGSTLGFNPKTTEVIFHKCKTEHFLDIIKKDEKELRAELSDIPGLSQDGIDEIVFKTSTVLDYYKKASFDTDEIVELFSHLAIANLYQEANGLKTYIYDRLNDLLKKGKEDKLTENECEKYIKLVKLKVDIDDVFLLMDKHIKNIELVIAGKRIRDTKYKLETTLDSNDIYKKLTSVAIDVMNIKNEFDNKDTDEKGPYSK